MWAQDLTLNKFEPGTRYGKNRHRYVPKPGGRKAYRTDRSDMELNLEEVKAVAALGLTIEEIAHFFNMSRSTFDRRREEFAQIDAAINQGRAVSKAKMAGKLFDTGMNGNVLAQIAFLKMIHGMRDSGLIEGGGGGGEGGQSTGVLVVPGTAQEEREWEERAIEQQRRLLEHHDSVGGTSG